MGMLGNAKAHLIYCVGAGSECVLAVHGDYYVLLDLVCFKTS